MLLERENITICHPVSRYDYAASLSDPSINKPHSTAPKLSSKTGFKLKHLKPAG